MLCEWKRVSPDLTIIHCEPGLWAAERIARLGGRVAVDFEDWFSHDLRPEDRQVRPVAVLQRLERLMLRNAEFCLTTTEAMAKALAEDAGAERIPVVLPNSFPISARIEAQHGSRDDRKMAGVSFHWFSQTIGPGRGLETLAAALPQLTGEWHVTLRGALRGYRTWFDETFPSSVRERVEILDPVPNRQLLARTMSHDVGLALEEPFCASRDLTATNKIFEYLRAGLAVIATRTTGQLEVLARCEKAGTLVEPGNPTSLARSMQQYIDEPNFLSRSKADAVIAGETWAWENFEPVIQQMVVKSLRRESL
jgi:glycosyltransferase involved in cell wall biosynthesis